MSNLVYLTLFYILFAGCVVYPPTEFITAGLTIEAIFANWLGSENNKFIQYHIRRIVLTKLLHSALPFGYVYCLLSCIELEEHFEEQFAAFIWWMCNSIAFGIIAYPLWQVLSWSQHQWNHPVVKNLSVFCNPDINWIYVAADINREYRRVDKINIRTNAVTRIVATDNWIMKISPYSIVFARQSDASLVVNRSDTHDISQHNRGQVQFVNIEVQSTQADVPPFTIRLNVLDFKDLQDKVIRPITVLPNVTFHKTKMERFVDAFKEQVQLNGRVSLAGELDLCIGCMQATSNVKLHKLCGDVSIGDNACVNCACRPMWCLDCIAKWFASRQDEAESDTWLSSKCTCPMCRNKFCLLDVSMIEHSG